MFKKILTSLLGLALIANTAKADVIFNGGLPDFSPTGQANDLGLGIISQSFVLNEPALVKTIDVFTFNTQPVAVLNYYLYNDDNGRPGDKINSDSSTRLDITDLGLDAYGYGNDYQYSLSFNSPIALTGNTKYWLGLSAQTDPGVIGWFTTPFNSNLAGLTDFAQYSPTGSNFWIPLDSQQQSFLIEGTGFTAAVPEPQYMIVALGLGAVFVVLRKKLK